jgi:tRNA(Ile)-lysidine synthase TilS/MesJ
MRRSGAELPGLLAQRLNDLGVKRGSRITVACSGGADSAAVADALGSGGAYSVLLAWVDHGLRGAEASEAEYRTVRMIAERISSPLATARVEPGEIER